MALNSWLRYISPILQLPIITQISIVKEWKNVCVCVGPVGGGGVTLVVTAFANIENLIYYYDSCHYVKNFSFVKVFFFWKPVNKRSF